VRAFLTTTCTDSDGKDKSINDAILFNLSDDYIIESRVLNFKDYGSNSSRTRTLVIGVRKDIEISPSDLFPTKTQEKALGEIIGHLPSLTTMGQICDKDTLHHFRPYTQEMRSWIADLEQGQGAFDNPCETKRPHYYKDDIKVFSKNGNGDKYTRQRYDKVAPCIHTRNDILASQNTVHPIDDRVFSVRELMLMMTIPSEFKWTTDDYITLNNLSEIDKQSFIKKHDINIRQSIGEAVPTAIFSQIGVNIKTKLEELYDTNDECVLKAI